MLKWPKLSQGGKLHTGAIIVLAFVGFILMFGADFLTPPKQVAPSPAQSFMQNTEVSQDENDFEVLYERSLRDTIAAIAGSGEVTVDVFLASSSRSEYARSLDTSEKTTQDQTATGGVSKLTTENRTNSQVTVVRSGTSEEPLVVQTFAPQIQGVLVIAEGASDPWIRLELTRAVTTALDISAHRVRVLSKEGK